MSKKYDSIAPVCKKPSDLDQEYSRQKKLRCFILHYLQPCGHNLQIMKQAQRLYVIFKVTQ